MKQSPLTSLQQLFQASVMQSIDDVGDSAMSAARDWIENGNGLLAPHARLAIYQDAYRLRLCECLRTEFPRVCRVIGEEAFDHLAQAYIEDYPSKSYTLGELSSQFDAFLMQTRPSRGSSHPDWYDLVIDAARFDLAVQHAFDGPGWDSPTVQSPALASDAVAAPFDVEVCPSLMLVSTRFPVRDLNSDVPVVDVINRRGTFHDAIHRHDFVVQHLEVEDGDIELLTALKKGSSIQEALRVGAAEWHDGDHLRQLFTHWSARGLLRTNC